jgi:cellobiose PTS system EIIC component
MAGFSEKFEDTMMTVAEVVGDNQYLMAIKDAFTAYMPFVIIGSLGTLLKTLISSTSTGLAQWVPALANLAPAFTALNFCTMTFMTIPVIFLIALNLARQKGLGNEYASAVVSVCAYISMVPSTYTVEGVEDPISAMATTTFGAQGLFIGMLTALIVTSFFLWLTTIDQIKIKMPPSVPAGIANSFNILIPVFIVLLVTSVFGWGFQTITGSYINEWIYAVMQAPLEAVFKSPAGIIGIVIISQLFWLLGIHGGLIVSPVRNPMFLAAIAANTAALEAGTTPDSPFTQGFWNCFVAPGGAGMTFCLIIALLLFSKRDDEKAIAKLGLLPGICGISEPVVFGVPLVLNPIYAIPFVFSGAVAVGIAVFATNIGFLPCNTVDVPFGLPLLLNAFIGHGWQGVVVQLIELVVCTIIWIPFVISSNKQYAKEQAAALAEAGETAEASVETAETAAATE